LESPWKRSWTKPLSPEASEPRLHVHGNSREAKVQELFRKLDEETQRVVLKQMKALADAKPTTEHKRHKAA
jgi:hypothetical protein